ncbi:hypothetical protein [Brackiella oedipodis]|uniref:hypothetical protein n=1 Tax=Brackiella oedipodis TaxID=124225 RepID=UPI000490FD50|nr:hypothetical protein [Brackiella oedipodis]
MVGASPRRGIGSSRAIMIGFALLLLTLAFPTYAHSWQQQAKPGVIQADFPDSVRTTSRELERADGSQLNLVHWSAQVGEQTYHVLYAVYPEQGARADSDAAWLLDSMQLQNIHGARQPLHPKIGERFKLWYQVMSQSFVINAVVLQKGNVVAQVYALGPDSPAFEQSSQKFLDSVRIASETTQAAP